jgi:hypothetical protein
MRLYFIAIFSITPVTPAIRCCDDRGELAYMCMEISDKTLQGKGGGIGNMDLVKRERKSPRLNMRGTLARTPVFPLSVY